MDTGARRGRGSAASGVVVRRGRCADAPLRAASSAAVTGQCELVVDEWAPVCADGLTFEDVGKRIHGRAADTTPCLYHHACLTFLSSHLGVHFGLYN